MRGQHGVPERHLGKGQEANVHHLVQAGHTADKARTRVRQARAAQRAGSSKSGVDI